MAFSSNRKINIAYSHALSKVNEREDQAPYESSKQGGHNVQGSLVWGDNVPFATNFTEADLNVANNPTILKKYTLFNLTPIAGSNNYAWYLNDGGAYIRNWIDEVSVINSAGNLSFGYVIRLYQASGQQIPADLFNIDPFAGVVLWNTSQNPIELGYTVPIKITAYTYIGESINQKLQGIRDSLTWQSPVLSKTVTDPSTLTPNEGDRYIVGDGAIDVWAGRDKEIATYVSGSWVYLVPVKGFTTYILSESATNNFNGVEWVSIGGSSLASNTVTNTTFFNRLLSPLDDNVQKALETLDNTLYTLNTIYEVNSDTTISNFGIYEVDCSLGDVVITLDDIVDVNGMFNPVKIIRKDNTNFTLTINTTQTIENRTLPISLKKQGNMIYLLSDYDTIGLTGRWIVLDDNIYDFKFLNRDNIDCIYNTYTYSLSGTPELTDLVTVSLNGIVLRSTEYSITGNSLQISNSLLGYTIDDDDSITVTWI